ncbi:zinc finger, CCHC-type containing protein [Tanacetum coccineum]
MLLSLAEKETAKETWTTLKTMYMEADRVKTTRVQTLKAEFEVLSMKETESVDEFATKLSNVVSNIRALGEKIEETYVVKKLLRAQAKTHEEKIKGHVEPDEKKLLLTHQEWSKRKKKQSEDDSKYGNKNYRGSSSYSHGRGRGRGRVQCQQYGHYAAECPNPRRERNQEANLTQENNDGEPALLLSTFDKDNRVKEVFLNEENGSVKFRDGSKVGIEGKGSILFECKNGEHHLLQEVYFIPRLCSNIISLGQLAEGGDQIIMHGSFLWVHDVKGKLLMKKSDEEVKLWHTRMGHVNYAALKLMSDKEMVQGLQKITNQNGLCEGCLEGKQARKTFPTHSNFMSTRRLELAHGDLYGPITPPTPAGSRYFLLLVDDYTRVMWVYFLKTKDQALNMFKKFRVEVEAEIGDRVTLFQTDRGGEFLSKEFSSYCEETRLKRHYTAPYSPQQNGIIER